MPRGRTARASRGRGTGRADARGDVARDARRAASRGVARRAYTAEEIIHWSSSEEDEFVGTASRARTRAARGRGGRGRGVSVASTSRATLRVGGVEVFLDRDGDGGGGSSGSFARVEYDYAGRARAREDGGVGGGDGSSFESDDGSSERSSEDWSDGSMSDEAALDYAANCARATDDGSTDDEDGSEDGSDYSLERELRAIARMNVDGEMPDPEVSSDEEEVAARFAAARADVEDDEDEDESEEDEDEMDKWTRVIAAAIEAGVSYIGLPPVKSSRDAPTLDQAARVARAHGCDLEIRGGGKRRHAVLHMRPESNKKPRTEARGSTRAAKRQPPPKKSRRPKPAMQFVFGGVAHDDTIANERDAEEADPRDKRAIEPQTPSEEPVAYPNRGARRAAEAQARDREYLERARARKRGVVVGAGHEFGAFEKHTTGFGSRMLAKMGFQGQGSGVGKSGEGIAEPLTATTRAKRVGLGAFGAER